MIYGGAWRLGNDPGDHFSHARAEPRGQPPLAPSSQSTTTPAGPTPERGLVSQRPNGSALCQPNTFPRISARHSNQNTSPPDGQVLARRLRLDSGPGGVKPN
jgi:hypothetical protein